MSGSRTHAAAGPLRTIWEGGAAAGLDDAGLIARFVEGRGRGERAEAAFRVLVERHAGMVERVCRQRLGDGHLAQDAAQAVFLVLARKAGSVRSTGSVAPWLHGVACRVASRARRKASALLALETCAALERGTPPEGPEPHNSDAHDWEALHDEVHRLPDRYRDPVVICYLGGQTYEEAALRLGCPVGTVRARLSRARDRLRDRLTRRGFGPAAGVIAWVDGAARVSPEPPAAAGHAWVESTLHAAHALQAGRSAAGTVSAAALALGSEGVRCMLMEKIRAAALCGLAVTTVGTGAVLYAAPQQQKKNTAGATRSAPETKTLERSAREKRVTDAFLAAALKREAAQRAFYKEGRITIDRYVDAVRQVKNAEVMAATAEGQVEANKRYVEKLGEIKKREESELEVGRGTKADLSEIEAEVARMAVELENPQARAETADEVKALREKVARLEAELARVVKFLSLRGLDADPVLKERRQ